MNDDTISRQAAIDAVQQHRKDVLGGYEYDEGVAFVYAAAHNHIIKVIKQLPSAVRRGRWERRGYHLHCSCCDWSADLATPHCPGCGAYLGGDV